MSIDYHAKAFPKLQPCNRCAKPTAWFTPVQHGEKSYRCFDCNVKHGRIDFNSSMKEIRGKLPGVEKSVNLYDKVTTN